MVPLLSGSEQELLDRMLSFHFMTLPTLWPKSLDQFFGQIDSFARNVERGQIDCAEFAPFAN